MAPFGDYECIDSFVMRLKIVINVRRLAYAMVTVDISKRFTKLKHTTS